MLALPFALGKLRPVLWCVTIVSVICHPLARVYKQSVLPLQLSSMCSAFSTPILNDVPSFAGNYNGTPDPFLFPVPVQGFSPGLCCHVKFPSQPLAQSQAHFPALVLPLDPGTVLVPAPVIAPGTVPAPDSVIANSTFCLSLMLVQS